LEGSNGKSIRDLMLLPLSSVREFFRKQKKEDESKPALLRRDPHPLRFLCDVRPGIPTLDRRRARSPAARCSAIKNLTTALRHLARQHAVRASTSRRVPAHRRDMGRVIDVMKRLPTRATAWSW